MRYLITLGLLLICCSATTSYLGDDFDQGYLKGTWLRVTERPSGISGLYYKDTTTYRIGIDPSIIPDTVLPYTKPLSFEIIYKQGGTTYGYIKDPRGQDFDQNGVPYITYTQVTLMTWALTDMVIGRPVTDSLTIQIGTEIYGLKR